MPRLPLQLPLPKFVSELPEFATRGDCRGAGL